MIMYLFLVTSAHSSLQAMSLVSILLPQKKKKKKIGTNPVTCDDVAQLGK